MVPCGYTQFADCLVLCPPQHFVTGGLCSSLLIRTNEPTRDSENFAFSNGRRKFRWGTENFLSVGESVTSPPLSLLGFRLSSLAWQKKRREPRDPLLYGFLFVAGVAFEPDEGADEAEGGADLVGEEALEGEVELDVAVGEQNEGGRATAAATSGLTIEASVPNCDIEVDGSFAGSTPSTLNLAPGKHDIVVKKTGYKDWTRSMTVVSGTIRVSADMVAAQ